MMRIKLFLLVLFQIKFSMAQTLGIYYYKEMFGIVHQNPSVYSNSVTTIACGHPLKVEKQVELGNTSWFLVSVAGEQGYLMKASLSESVPNCLEKNYPRFFSALNLDLGELYYWGRLYDLYMRGRSKVR